MSKVDGTVTRSFRVYESTIKIIEEEADQNGVSVNTVVNQLLTRFAKIERLTAKVRSIRLTEEVAKGIFEAAPEDKLVELAKKYGKGITLNNQILALTGGTSLENIIQFLKIAADMSSINYTDLVHEGKRTVSFMHNLNRQYSVFLANVIGSVFEDAGIYSKILTDDRVVEIEFSRMPAV